MQKTTLLEGNIQNQRSFPNNMVRQGKTSNLKKNVYKQHFSKMLHDKGEVTSGGR